MKHIRITEKNFGFDEKELLSEDFDQILFIADTVFGTMGVTSFRDVTIAVDSMLDNLALTVTTVGDVPDDERTLEMVEDVAVVKTIMAMNAASMTLGPIGREMLDNGDDLDDERRGRYEEMLAIADEIMALSRRVADLSSVFVIDNGDEEEATSDQD